MFDLTCNPFLSPVGIKIIRPPLVHLPPPNLQDPTSQGTLPDVKHTNTSPTLKSFSGTNLNSPSHTHLPI